MLINRVLQYILKDRIKDDVVVMWQRLCCLWWIFFPPHNSFTNSFPRHNWNMSVCSLAPPRVLPTLLHPSWPQRLPVARIQRWGVGSDAHRECGTWLYYVLKITGFPSRIQPHPSLLLALSLFLFLSRSTGGRSLGLAQVSQQDLEQVSSKHSYDLLLLFMCLWFMWRAD